MPRVLVPGKTCKKCGATGGEFRNRWNATNQKWYVQSTCVSCEMLATRAHQEANRQYWRDLNSRSYLNKVGCLRNVLGRSDEDRKQRAREKAARRSARTKNPDELTHLAVKEARHLAKLRTEKTNIKWSVDHVVPLFGNGVSGLHRWNNLQVIPLVTNLKKGNRYAVHQT